MSAAFSPIMMVGALVLQDGTRGMTEASQTRRPSIPCTFRSSPTTACLIRAHLAGADRVVVGLGIGAGVVEQSSSVVTPAPAAARPGRRASAPAAA